MGSQQADQTGLRWKKKGLFTELSAAWAGFGIGDPLFPMGSRLHLIGAPCKVRTDETIHLRKWLARIAMR